MASPTRLVTRRFQPSGRGSFRGIGDSARISCHEPHGDHKLLRHRQKDSAPIPVPGGRNWSLSEGQYEIIMKANGKSVTFRVPEERSVLLPGGAPRLMPYVNDALELNKL